MRNRTSWLPPLSLCALLPFAHALVAFAFIWSPSRSPEDRLITVRIPDLAEVKSAVEAVGGEISHELGAIEAIGARLADWAYPLSTLIGLSAVLAYLRFRRRKLAKETRYRSELENQVLLRTSALSEQNAELMKLIKQLRRSSVTDSLTGLKNRRYVDEFIDTEIARVGRLVRQRCGRIQHDSIPNISPGLFFMMIDLDRFKLINDFHGHAAGDRILIQVGEILTRCCRSSDTVVRWGGDEFLVVGNGSGRSSVEKLAERIRTELAATRYRLEDGLIGRISASIGVSVYPFACADADSLPWERVVALADQAAYIAKNNQRNAWLGIYPGRNAATIESTMNQPYELSREGVIEIRTSIRKELSLSDRKKK